ncbi:DUF354 domain-containing protein [Marilutibacter chinensis]|uniref:DUF354 domain-containing protein n=1 Tax=Marilutibacter chinensis TaxID=2912247 RepID=A0ABS9HTL6_9GAMM|nr:DUF354 domain-containing protein [Lysobacter chinensis]MCF7222043.1 DUF354 domain-containing protein [Lysobacter chinensis]
MASILIDVCHPAHVHFFRQPIEILRSEGHTVHVSSRDKDVATQLLEAADIAHHPLGRAASGPLGLLKELVVRDWQLWRLARKLDVDVIAALGGTFAVHAATLHGVPSIVFYDTEMAHLQNRITYPLASRVVVPRCYQGWLPSGKSERYAGYHELSYLHPNRFQPDPARAHAGGLHMELPTFLVRLVSWTANHDIGDKGLGEQEMTRVVSRLEAVGHVIISAESSLPERFGHLRYRGSPEDMHHLMAFCSGYFGESATMASECAVLGVPAVYAANSSRGYTDEQEARYGLVRNVRALDSESIEAGLEWLLERTSADLSAARQAMLNECIDVADHVARRILDVVASRPRRRG